METKLAKDEVLVKTWNYAGTEGKSTVAKELTVTNRRIIHRSIDKFGVATQEYFVRDIKSLNGVHATKRSVLGLVICCILAVLCIVAAIVFKFYYLFAGVAIFVLIGVLSYIFSKKSCFALNLELVTHQRGEVSEFMSVSAGLAQFAASGKRSKKNAKQPSIDAGINYEVAKEIVETIGALLLENCCAPINDTKEAE